MTECYWNVNLQLLLLDLSLDFLLLIVRCEVHCPGEGSVRHAPRVRLPQHGLGHTRQTKTQLCLTLEMENVGEKLTVNC